MTVQTRVHRHQIIIKILLPLIIFIVLSFLAINIHLDPMVKSLFNQEISSIFQGNLSAASIRLSLWQGSLVLQNVALKQPAGFSSGNMIQATRIKIRVQLLPLLQKKLILNSITLVQPQIHLVQLNNGRTNFEYYSLLLKNAFNHKTVSTSKDQPLTVNLRRLIVRGGNFTISSPRITESQPTLAFEDIRFRLIGFRLPNPNQIPASFSMNGFIAAPHRCPFKIIGNGVFLTEALNFSAETNLGRLYLSEFSRFYPHSKLEIKSGTADVRGTIKCRDNYLVSNQQVKVTDLKLMAKKENILTRTLIGISANSLIRILNDRNGSHDFEFSIEGPTSHLKVHLKETITTSVMKSLTRKFGFKNESNSKKTPSKLKESGRMLKNKLHALFGN